MTTTRINILSVFGKEVHISEATDNPWNRKPICGYATKRMHNQSWQHVDDPATCAKCIEIEGV